MTRLSKRCFDGSMFPGSLRIPTSAQPNAGTRLIFGMCDYAEAPTMNGISLSGPARSERWSARGRTATSTANMRTKAHPGSGRTNCYNCAKWINVQGPGEFLCDARNPVEGVIASCRKPDVAVFYL